MERRQAFRNEGMQVSSIDDNMVLGRAHVPLTEINDWLSRYLTLWDQRLDGLHRDSTWQA